MLRLVAVLLLLLLLLLLLFLSGLSSGNALSDDTEAEPCSIFIAPSSVKRMSGMGVFTTRDISKGEPILWSRRVKNHDNDRLYFLAHDNPSLAATDPTRNLNAHSQQWNRVFQEYWWVSEISSYIAMEAKLVAEITFGILPNHHCILKNADHHFPNDVPYDDDDSSLSSSLDGVSRYDKEHGFGTGAFSYHRGRRFDAERFVPAGSEIFITYWQCNEEELQQTHYPEWVRSIPLDVDSRAATMRLQTMWQKLLEQHDHDSDQIPNEMELNFDGEQQLSFSARSLLPETVAQLKQIMLLHQQNADQQTAKGEEGGNEERHNELARTLALTFDTTPRTPEWIQENGICMEHLIPGTSTIPHAGRGAFCQHALSAGDIIVPVPLLHIVNKTALQVVQPGSRIVSEHQQQLLLNYCFGHPESTLLLCPTSNAVLINHCSNRTKEWSCPNGPNAAIRWAQPSWDPQTTEVWLKASLEDMIPQSHRLLAMEVVALRDIHPNEEVFLDYGLEWEQAWARHVKTWEPIPRPSDPTQAHFGITAANQAAKLEHLVLGSFRHNHKNEKVESHPSITTACRYWYSEADEQARFQQHQEPNNAMASLLATMSDEEILQMFGDDGSIYRSSHSDTDETSYWPCDVYYEDNRDIGGDDDDDDDNNSDDDDEPVEPTYLVRIYQHPELDDEPEPWHENGFPRLLHRFPRRSIRYFPRPYQSDIFLPNAFRHAIGIPDSMFPQQWRNLDKRDRQ